MMSYGDVRHTEMPANEKVKAAVERLYAKNPDATTDDFRKVAERADHSVRTQSPRSFNATYIVPIKRRSGTKKRKKAGAGKRKVRRTRTARSAPRRASTSKMSHATRAGVRALVLQRDQEVIGALTSGGDARQAYALGSGVDAYIDALAAALRK